MESRKCYFPDCTDQANHICRCDKVGTLSCTFHIMYHLRSLGIDHCFDFIELNGDAKDAVAGHLLNEEFKLRRLKLIHEKVFKAGDFGINKEKLLSNINANMIFVNNFYNDVIDGEKPEISNLLSLDAKEAVDMTKEIISSNDRDRDLELEEIENRCKNLEDKISLTEENLKDLEQAKNLNQTNIDNIMIDLDNLKTYKKDSEQEISLLINSQDNMKTDLKTDRENLVKEIQFNMKTDLDNLKRDKRNLEINNKELEDKLQRMNSDFQTKIRKTQLSSFCIIFALLVIFSMLLYWRDKNNDKLLENRIINTYRSIIFPDPQNIEISKKENELGFILLNEKKYEEGLLHFNKALQLNPNDDTILYNQGVTLYKLKRYEDARNSLKEATRINPNNHDAQNYIGSTFLYQAKFKQAIEYYDKAIKIDPNNSIYHSNKGWALEKLERYEDARNSFKEAIRINSNNYDAQNGIGNTFYYEQKFNQAIEYYDKAINIDPNNSIYHSNKGHALQKLGKQQEADQCFKKAEKLKNNS